MEQVTAWPNEQVRAFWERWYFPANCTLYVVGDFDRSTEEVEALIQKVCMYGAGGATAWGPGTAVWLWPSLGMRSDVWLLSDVTAETCRCNCTTVAASPA